MIGRSHSSRTARIACSITGKLGKGLENEKIDAAFEQRLDLLSEHLPRFVERCRAERLDAQTQRADRAGDKDLVAGGFARDPGGRDVDLAQFAFEPVRLQFVPRRAKRIGLDNVGAGIDVFLVHLADKVGSGEIQLVVAAVDVNALVVKARTDRAVKNVDAVRFQNFAKVFHIAKSLAKTARLVQK